MIEEFYEFSQNLQSNLVHLPLDYHHLVYPSLFILHNCNLSRSTQHYCTIPVDYFTMLSVADVGSVECRMNDEVEKNFKGCGHD
jgi:hypothetical protein